MNIIPFNNFTIEENIKNEILVIGMNNIGFEIVKNLILSNILNITIRDIELINEKDIDNMIYFTKSYIGNNRAESYLNLFYLINNKANIRINNDILTEDTIKKYNIIIFTNNNLNEIYYVSEFTRKYNIKLISTEVRGIYGYIFTDYGDKYISTNKNGKFQKSGKIIKILNDSIETEFPCDLEINDKIYIKFNQDIICRCRITDLNKEKNIFIIKNFNKVIKKNNIDINDIDLYFVEYKDDIEYTYDNILESYLDPKFNNNLNDQKILHLINFAINKFFSKYKKNPKNLKDIEKIKEYIKIIDNTINFNKINLNKIIEQLDSSIYSINSFFAGLVSYEILKIINHIGIPINQWLYVNFESRYININENNINNFNIVIDNLNSFGLENLKNIISEKYINILINDKSKITNDDLNGILFFDEINVGDNKLKITKKNMNSYFKNYNEINVKKYENELIILSNDDNVIKKKNQTPINVNYDLTIGEINFGNNYNTINNNNDSLKITNISIEECINWSKNILKYFFNTIPINFMNWNHSKIDSIFEKEYKFIIDNHSETPNDIILFAYKFWKYNFSELKKVDDDSLYYITIVANIWCQICYQPSVTISLVNKIIKKIENQNIVNENFFDNNNQELNKNRINKDIFYFDTNNLDNLEIYFNFVKYSVKLKLKKYKIIVNDDFIKNINIYYSSYIVSSIMSSLTTIFLGKYYNYDKKIKINLMENRFYF